MNRTKGTPVKRKLAVAAAAGALAVALALVVAACGGNGDSNGVASLTDTTGQTTTGAGANGSGTASKEDREKAQLEYAKCMREHGVDMPDPVNGELRLKAQRGDEKKVQEAQKACQGILEGVAPELNEEQKAKLREAALEFAKCMREHGVDMPDPKVDESGGLTQLMPEGSSPDDPKVQKAQKACQPILNAGRPKNPSVQSQ
jgi:hypothetical protein